MKRMRIFQSGWLPLAAIIAWLGVGCETVPETGRKQLSLISADQEMKLGITAFEQQKKDVPVSKDAAANAMLQRVGQRIARVAPLPNAQWEFVLFESKEVNAYCLPGGKVGVFTGILPITKNEEGLATVIGHEVAHAVAHHGRERMSEAMVMQGLGQVVGAAMSVTKPELTQATMVAYGMGTQVGRELPHGRKQESEADYMGLIYMARAGYNPETAVAFWQRFAEFNQRAGGNNTPAFLRTHPLDEKRIADLQAAMPRAKPEYRPAQ